jgi:predicted nucleic acid-binding protein
MNIVDASGWIEYFLDTPRADLFAPVIENTSELLVTSINLYEVHRVLSRKLPNHLRDTCLSLMRRATVIDFTDARAIEAADLSIKHQLAMADAAMYAMALAHQATLWTQDANYQGLVSVKYLSKWSEIFHHCTRSTYRANRQTSTDYFTKACDVGLHIVFCLRATLANTEASNHFVKNKQGPGLIACCTKTF